VTGSKPVEQVEVMAMKHRILTTVAGALVMALALSPVGAAAQALSLRISGENPITGLDLIMAQTFAENLEAELGDDFDHEFFHTQALGNEVVHLQMIRTGQIDVYPMGSDAVQLDSRWAIFDMPFLISDREVAANLLDGEIGEQLRQSMREQAGLEVLAFGEIGFRVITNNVRPIVKPEDLQGVKLRVPGSETRLLTFQTYGASPVTMNLGELYLALQQGTVDGQENPLAGTVSRSFHEVQKYFSMSNHVYTPVTLVMNAQKYNSLTPEQQDAVKRAALAAAKHTRELGTRADVDLLKKLQDEGQVEINEIDLAAFQEASKPVWDAIGGIAGEEFTAAVIAAATE
jgi:tripartite ATP-independent transporter DctP family solute receptor